MLTTPAKKQTNSSLRSILDGSIRQRRSNAIPKTSKQSVRGTANLTVIEQSEPTLLSFRENNTVMQSEMIEQDGEDEPFDFKQTRSVSNSEVKIKNQ